MLSTGNSVGETDTGMQPGDGEKGAGVIQVAHVVQSLRCGGLEHVVIQLAERQKKDGYAVNIICLDGAGELAPQAEARGIPVIALNKRPAWDWAVPGRLARWLRQKGVQVVHTHNFGPLIYGTIAARMAGVKTVNTRHGRAGKRAPWWIWRWNQAVIAVSHDAERELLRHNRVSARKVRVIYNGIDIQRFTETQTSDVPPFRFENNVKEDTVVIGCVARLAPEKDHLTLLKAVEILQGRLEGPWQVWLVGDGPLHESLQQVCRDARLTERVKFWGYREDTARFYIAFDMFVLSSLREGISLTLLEAMATGRAVVATAVGGNPEVVVDQQTGRLVASGDPEALAGALAELIADKGRRQQMGVAGRRRIKEMFTMQHMARAHAKLYASVMGQ